MHRDVLLRALCVAALLSAGPALAQSPRGAGQPLPSQNTTEPYLEPQQQQPAATPDSPDAQPPLQDPMQPGLTPGQSVQPAQPTTPGRTPAVDEALRMADVDPGPIGTVSDASPAPQFVAMAGSSGLFEIASSRLALQRTQDPGVREFAQRMVDDHNAANQALRMAVANIREVGLNRVGGMEPRHQQWMSTLQQANGEDFERLYIHYQALGHKEAVELFQNYAWNGENNRLREFAVSWMPMLRQHHAMAMNLTRGDRVS